MWHNRAQASGSSARSSSSTSPAPSATSPKQSAMPFGRVLHTCCVRARRCSTSWTGMGRAHSNLTPVARAWAGPCSSTAQTGAKKKALYRYGALSADHECITHARMQSHTHAQTIAHTPFGETCFVSSLAGTERLNRSNATGNRRDEAISINKSLSALGNVMQARTLLIFRSAFISGRGLSTSTRLGEVTSRLCPRGYAHYTMIYIFMQAYISVSE